MPTSGNENTNCKHTCAGSRGKHRNLWFKRKGRPLLITPDKELSEEVKAFFTIRNSWAWKV